MKNLEVKLKCKNCGEVVSYYPYRKEEEYQKCQNCATNIGMRTETKIDGILTLDDFEFLSIHRDLADKILDRDFFELKSVYESAEQENKEKILSVVDKFSLVLNRDDAKTLDFVLEKLNELFDSIIEEKHKSFFETLNKK